MEVGSSSVQQQRSDHGNDYLVLPGAEGTDKRTESWDTPDAVERDDGSLCAPVMYASLVLGMIAVYRGAADDGASEGVGSGGGLGDRDAGTGQLSVRSGVAEGGNKRAEALWNRRVSDEVG